MNEKRVDYLKVNYSEGMLSDEYFINFKGSMERGTGIGGEYTIERKSVIEKDKTNGLVKVVIAQKEEKTSNILICGLKDVGCGAFFTVPNEELVKI